MAGPDLSSSLEDYLETIAALLEEEGRAHCREIALRMGVKMPSVTTALQQLSARGLIDYRANQPVLLTAKGRTLAAEVARRHAVLQWFLSSTLRLDPERSRDLACKMEHILDTDAIDRLIVFSEAIEGRSDAKELRRYLSEAMAHFDISTHPHAHCVLAQLQDGEHATIEELGGNLTDADAKTLARQGVVPGKTVRAETGPDGLQRFFVDDAPAALSPGETENIWVKRHSRAQSLRRFRRVGASLARPAAKTPSARTAP